MTSNSSKAMISGCCVCSDERGWSENPLVYCDGLHCSVAVHLACYGIKKEDLKDNVDWFCRICQSQERHVKVKCELCPSRDGAFKMTDNNTWAHVICSLYIPEVRFGDVTTMEPIILSSIPIERYNRTCFICDERGKENKSKMGACMQCNKPNCKQYFHVTCAQASGLLCEESGNNDDNVKYCGYCKHHIQKVRRDHNVKLIPAFKPGNQTEKSEPSLGKKSHHITDTSKPPKKKQKFYSSSSQHDSDNESKRDKVKSKRKRTSSTSKDQSSNKHNSSKESNNSIFDHNDSSSDDSIIAPPTKKTKENKEIKKNIFDSNTDDDNDDDDDDTTISKKNSSTSSNKSDLDRKKLKKTSSKNKEIDKPSKENKKIKKKKDESSSNKKEKDDNNLSKINKTSKLNDDKLISNKLNSNEILDKQIYKSMSPKNNSISLSNKKDDFEDDDDDDDEDDKTCKEVAIRNELPKKNFNLPELIKHKSILDEEKKSKQKEHKTLEDLLEHTWNQTSQFVMEQQNQYIGSLISCLYELNSENIKLEEKVKNLIARKDHLVAVNSRLSIPLTTNAIPINNSDNLDNSNQSSIVNTLTNNLTETPTTNLFHSSILNQQQQNFTSAIHNTATSTPSPNTQQQQHKQQQNNHTNYFNHVNSSLNNQNYNNKSLDLNSNLSNSFLESLHNQSSNQSSTSTNLNKPPSSSTANNNLSYNTLLQAAVNGQFSLNNSSNTSSPSSKFNQFNNLSGNTNNFLPAQIFQTLFQNSQYQSVPNNSVLNGNQNKR